LFRMPIPIAIYTDGSGSTPQIQPLEVTSRRNHFAISLDHKPAAVLLDPNTSVLMQANFVEGRGNK
jgi:hypothetical protein